ncbi:hypothetical protein GOODEAATRI_019608 [Goodea atripinnis]|uniref:Uncharacterized protein n=1 Tax=Goodea atripinnis TaxID=208336 RepID=A0ABV0NW00_9TELE
MILTDSDHTSGSNIQPSIHMPIYLQPVNDRHQTTINLISVAINEQKKKTFHSIYTLTLVHAIKLTDCYVGCVPTQSPQACVYLHPTLRLSTQALKRSLISLDEPLM